jgi:GH15 family glucan-1,4-alpha-glucosidase
MAAYVITPRAQAPAETAIERHGVIGDGRSCALVDGEGAIAWLSWPRFDSDPIFAALLDATSGGAFRVHPVGPSSVTARYLDETNVLVTTFIDDTGMLELVDLMSIDEQTIAPEHELVRILVCRRGQIDVDVVYDPRPRFALRTPKLRVSKAGVLFDDRASTYALRSSRSLEWTPRREGGVRARVRMRAGDRIALALTYAREAPLVLRPLHDHGASVLDRTVAFWRDWASRARYDGPHRDLVVRSALALKLLCYAPSGAIIAAPTTSLPELRGSHHNWDYRFCWLRDAAFTARALFGLGYEAEAQAFCDWLLHATRLTHPRLRVFYDVFGERPGRERVLDHLSGWQGARPVRVGNGADTQLQLDVHGEVIDAVAQSIGRSERPDGATMDFLEELGAYVCQHWAEPDEGIWEPRTGREHHVHSRLMEWVALDRLLGLADRGLLGLSSKRRASFSETRDAIAREIRARGWNERIGAYVSTLDGTRLDATALLLSWYGFEEASSPRMISTARRLDEVLGDGPGHALLRRNLELPDGGSFAACAFWAVDHLARGGGTLDGALERFETLLTFAGPLGLYGEIIEPHTGAALGNYPQGFSHLALVNAAMSIEARSKEQSKEQRR